MKLHLSRVLAILVAQAALNVLLSSWLYIEYVNNKFMQEYMAGLWTANALPVSLGLVAASIVAGGSFLAFSRREAKNHGLKSSQQKQVEVPEGLAALDVCPFCNISLVTLSDNRFQCRKCHRYFKK